MMANRQELIEKVAKKSGLPKRGVGIYLSILLEVVQLILARSGELKLAGFGTLKASDVPARKGVNPFTKKAQTFAQGTRISFKPGKPLKEAVRKGSYLTKVREAGRAKAAAAKPTPAVKNR
jgi:DNA-binding protein HU-beta